MFKFKLRAKITLFIAAIVFLCVAIISFDFHLNARKALIESIRRELKDLAVSLALSIDPQVIEKVLAGDESSKIYLDLKQKLHSFTLIGEGKIYNAYVMVPTPKKDIWEFVADNELEDREKMAALHEEYDVSRFEEMKQSLIAPAVDKEITTDKWGDWLSAYAPIYDKRSRPFAVLGIDMRAADLGKLKRRSLTVASSYLFLGAILSLILGYIGAYTITRPILALSAGIKDIWARKYGTTIDIQRKDEIGELIELFNKMSQKLNEVDKIKSDFLSVISHELYTPLTPIRAGAKQLKSMAGLGDDSKQIVAMIDRQAQKLQDLMDEILDFSWLEIQEWKLIKEPVNVKLIAEEAIGQLRPAIQRKEIEFVSDFNSELPVILADKKRILHVIKIFIDNAVKFTPEKGRVMLKVSRTEAGIEFMIQDTGIGIAPENLEKIFDGFYQTEYYMTRARGGLGLGLAIAKRIVEAHGGSIRAESPGLGRGSRFIFTLPVV
ncbi:hypothetical protein AMJ44_07720 [candidate division WOR-1 bacterium DG_54_3]|uniref:histidine kinase n=1 Tax=candidate division WOR-1 bacterium DG_54_3 TaxID=1703775 RepID=A0A0S7XWI9_UNCSA|nr:MAG: hypothetical protein AMJ44_07720 [candidate division WOR-1 bacterium DG_54_3]